MLFFKMWTKKYLTILMVILGLIGSVFFFPVQMDDQSSCCYESVFGSDKTCPCRQAVNDHADHMQNSSQNIDQAGHEHGSVLLSSYLHHYAFPWWISVGLLVAGCFLWIREKDKRQKTEDKKK